VWASHSHAEIPTSDMNALHMYALLNPIRRGTFQTVEAEQTQERAKNGGQRHHLADTRPGCTFRLEISIFGVIRDSGHPKCEP
jgi:hypothetical protein